jgi:superfamily II DNA or RNA helicase
MQLRDYQSDIADQVLQSTSNDLIQLDTGGGKTPIMAAIANESRSFIAVAHRNILITQISEKLAAFDITHNAIATTHTKRRCVLAHRRALTDCFDESHQSRFVASIDSIIARYKRGRLSIDLNERYTVLIDEAHHCLDKNKWGKLREIFPNARFIGFTATPVRHDGQSLHIEKGGLFERLIQAEALQKDSVRTLSARGYLSDFKVYSFDGGFDKKKLSIRCGEYTQQSLELIITSKGGVIVGDAVREYKKRALGKQAVAMCVSIKNAEETARKFREDGIPAACISSKMTASEVSRITDLFLARQIQVLCNVDMIGEGFDMPGIEVLIMLRKTASFVSFRQWIGRALRPLPMKDYAIIHDHVGNVLEHGNPDEHTEWNLLTPPPKTQKTNLIPCSECSYTYHAWKSECPECGAQNPLDERANIGGHYIDLAVIDVALCERKRTSLKREEILEKEIVWPTTSFHSGAVGALCEKLLKWFVENLRGTLTVREINDFLQDTTARTTQFWVDNFTVKDLQTSDPQKCKKVYKKWLAR